MLLILINVFKRIFKPANKCQFIRPIKGRNYAIQVTAAGCGFPLHLKSDFDFSELKKTTLPFGQVPYLVHGDIKMSQSMAILRYIARKGGIEGDSDQDYALNEMLIEEFCDINKLLDTAMFSNNKNAAYDVLFATDGAM